MTTLIDKVKRTLLKYQLLKTQDRVLVGVSGGADSVTLLFVLHQLRHELGIKIFVGHINHQLRKSANDDQIFVEKLCRTLAIPCFIRKINISTKNGKCLEEEAREKRYKNLMQMALAKNINIIATAHHQDDVAETVLMRIIRGTGLLGLQGILPLTQINHFHIIRPLIELRKEEILKWLKERDLKFRMDPTNKNIRFLRNKLRLHLLPLLKAEYNKSISEGLAHLAENIALDYDFLLDAALKYFNKVVSFYRPPRDSIKIEMEPFLSYHPSIKRMIIRLAIYKLKNNFRQISFVHLKEIEDLINNRPIHSVVHLPDGISFQKAQRHLLLQYRRKT